MSLLLALTASGGVTNYADDLSAGAYAIAGQSITDSHGYSDALGFDPTFSQVSLLLHCNGADGSTTFTDSSDTPKTVTAVGNAQIDTAISQFGGGSLLIANFGDYLSVPNSSAFDFGSGDFTIDLWINCDGVLASDSAIISKASSGFGPFEIWSYGDGGGGIVEFRASKSGTAWDVSIPGTMPLFGAGWHHLAVTRSGNVFRLFEDGVLAGSQTVSGALMSNSSPVYIGGRPIVDSYSVTGNYDEIRIKKGEALYTSNFTPPTQEYPYIGNYTISGQNITDVVARNDGLSTGAYVIAGQDITDVKTSAATSYADDLSAGAYLITGNSLTDSVIHQSIDGGGGRSTYWQPYWIDNREWEKKIPPAAVKAIERVARSRKTGEEAERALMLELDDNQARYAKMLHALKESQFNTLKALRAKQLRESRLIEEEDSEILLLLG